MRRSAPLLLLVAILLVGACGDDEPTVEAGADATDTTATSTTTTSAKPADGFATTTVSTPPVERGLLSDVKATTVGDVDRVTFTFEGALPGYRVGFVDRPVIQDGSGEEISVDGESVLQVHFEPASGFDLETGEGRPVYKGPERLDLATRTVLDVVRQGDFEANLEWVIGLDTKVPFRVRTESAPNRVIVEVPVSPES
jgi:hypothetical protein